MVSDDGRGVQFNDTVTTEVLPTPVQCLGGTC